MHDFEKKLKYWLCWELDLRFNNVSFNAMRVKMESNSINSQLNAKKPSDNNKRLYTCLFSPCVHSLAQV